MSNLIECKNVSYKYIDDLSIEKMAISNINLNVKKGEFLVILGRNGSGKSTLSKHFNGILVPYIGDVYVDGINTRDENLIWNVREKIGMVFQNPDNQIVATIVEEDVAFGPENLGIPSSEIRKRVDNALKIVRMDNYKKHAPHMLSGGQKQRVAIAGVLAMEPSCIVFDESTAMLDPSGRKEVLSTIEHINKDKEITIVLITHHMEEAINADRIVVLDDGKIVMEGTPREIFSKVREIKRLGLDVPSMTELAFELSEEGICIKEDILTIDEMVKELCRLK